MCLCVCPCRVLQLLNVINKVQARVSSHTFLAINLWICKIMFRSRVIAGFAYIVAFSEQCVAKLVMCSVATLLSS